MESLNILLVKPFQETNEIQPPLGLGYVASTVKKEHNIRIIDGIKENLTYEGFRKLVTNNHYDIIGIQCYTADINTVKTYAKIIKKFSPKTIIVIGGPQPSMDAKGTIEYLTDVDFGFVCEAELSFPAFIQLLKKKNCDLKKITINELKKIPGIAFIRNNETIITPHKMPQNLDDYDPSYELYNLKNYPTAPHGAFCRQYPTAPIIITRGCPFGCKYCGGSLISGFKIRSHSVDYAINQIVKLNKVYGVREIHIEDDNFTMKRSFVEEFCKRLIDLNLGVTWACPNGVRIDTLDEPLLKLMMKSGMYSVSVGIESASDKIRKSMGKNLTTAQIYDKMTVIDKVGINTIGFFILGYPGETVTDIEQTIKFACKLNLKRANFSAFKPFPGTPIYNELVAQGKLKEVKWENFTLHKIAWAPEGMTEDQLDKLRKKALWKFYFRPKIMWSMLMEIKSFENFKFILLRVYRLLFKY